MAGKQVLESQGVYTEGIRVKISERYKPPPKVNLVMTYSQRLNLNKQIQDSLPKYEFVLEKTVKERMKEWRNARAVMREERRNRLEKAKEEMKAREELRKAQLEEQQKQEKEEEELEIKCINEGSNIQQYEPTNTSNHYDYDSSNSNALYNSSVSNRTYTPLYSCGSNLLIPEQATMPSYTNILTPIPLTRQEYQNKPVDKSPFNISDFEADTSSPFDNMELKSINDMEELAQVLKRDDVYNNKVNTNASFYSNYQPVSAQSQPNYSNFPVVGTQYNYSIPNRDTYTTPQPIMSTYSNTNGYYYSPETVPPVQSFTAPYQYPSQNEYTFTSKPDEVADSNNRKSCKSVPDIVKALETELDNTHIDPPAPVSRNSPSSSTNRPKSTDAIYPKAKNRVEDLENPFYSLPKNLQELSKSISSMGFPLAMVARTCKNLGNDQKKIVEHLLAMTQLLDLGFSEKDVSTALLACNNDRDKALDRLIS